MLLVLGNQVIAQATPLHQTFNQIFTAWSDAFNHQDLKKTCDLFSKNLVFEFQDAPIKNYNQVCNNFKKIFNEKNRRYHYAYKIHHIYAENNLAAIRITWFLKIDENGKTISNSREEGMDVFRTS